MSSPNPNTQPNPDLSQLSAGGLGPEEPVRVNHTKRNIVIAVIVVVLLAALAFFGYRGFAAKKASAAKGTPGNPVKIGVVGVTNPDWVVFKQQAQKLGISVQLVDFQDYTSEDPAVDSGSLDMNESQHILLLANYNVKNHKDLQPIGATGVFPLGMYSTKYKDVSQIPAGASIPVPNDETNLSRALGVLDQAKLIKLKHPWTPFTSQADLDEANSKVKVVPVKGAQVPKSLNDPDVAAGIMNNDFVADAGLKPSESIFRDDPHSNHARPYINVFIVKKADINNPLYLKLAGISHTKEFKAALQQKSKGTCVFADQYSGSQLRGFLSDVESDMRKSQSA
ncbi:MetQ/NlpA family ABC transporter substrate-binding protein [Bifidobacterium sp. ESL0690]|uniref:MetQ/NlpA family ABC transporter substrate-binding protein n=1 Tax=Bifidobacterium sp. ESL0690 TaxID=2983214 RepID=UPI0023F87C5A|nr:MetQ/NlpA family ABC transporter substrate-binding protein [Bifidobacterium sp. ESL0690]WEV46115.1 MetQ/NlpA family ABC transporter substrate-binding protein [Bifidobacterium sp. ESL0690]